MKKKTLPRHLDNAGLNHKLLAAARAGQHSVIKDLLRQGADINAQDDEKNMNEWQGGVPGSMNLRGNWRAVQPPAGNKGKSGHTALIWACKLHRTRAAEALLDAGADPKVKNLIGETALHYICMDPQMAPFVARMVAAGANVNAQNLWGATPLMFALHDRNIAVAEALLAQGADPFIKTTEGHDAFAVARHSGVDAAFIKKMQQLAEKNKIVQAREKEKRRQAETDARISAIKSSAGKISILRKPRK